MADRMKRKLTTNLGAPVPNNRDSLTAGPRGPMLVQDVWYLEKMASFDREVIPERRMHAKGSGAFGTFTVTNDITNAAGYAVPKGAWHPDEQGQEVERTPSGAYSVLQ